MTSTSAIKNLFTLIFTLFICSVWSQSEDRRLEQEAENQSNSIVSSGVKGSFGVAYNFIIPTGDKYIGLAYEGKGGYNLKFKLFVFDGIFLGGSTGSSYFENIDTSITGNYNKIRLGSHYFFLGYEYQPIKKLAIGISTSVFGEARYKNGYKGGEDAFQIDKAKLRAFEAYLDYFISPVFSINLSYTYRNDKTNIRTSSNLQSRFDRAQFSIVGLGINFQFGKDAIISRSKKSNVK
ncbi:hypothetical protein [Lacinutrix jangbogonensis]|uniref:hypothetical protein n=1 Tax=Lacinutrix jangbogonensis TaxID=1469557 RepID=UPI00053F18DC|nr:hypothetical protein [Lacinutrix jangbogonensis]